MLTVSEKVKKGRKYEKDMPLAYNVCCFSEVCDQGINRDRSFGCKFESKKFKVILGGFVNMQPEYFLFDTYQDLGE